MTKRLEGRRALITGAAANIGAATAEILVREGATVVIGDRDLAAQATADRLTAAGGTVHFVKVDVSDEESVRALVDKAVDLLGGLDILISNAGVQPSGLLVETTAEAWDTAFAVNVRAQFLAAKYAIPHLKAGVNGNIVNMASLAALRGGAGIVAYSSSKGAVVSLTNALSNEIGGDGIRVNAVAPGWIDTSFNEPIIAELGGRDEQAKLVKANVPLGRQGTSSEVAEVIVFLASDAASYVHGQTIAIDGGIY